VHALHLPLLYPCDPTLSHVVSTSYFPSVSICFASGAEPPSGLTASSAPLGPAAESALADSSEPVHDALVRAYVSAPDFTKVSSTSYVQDAQGLWYWRNRVVATPQPLCTALAHLSLAPHAAPSFMPYQLLADLPPVQSMVDSHFQQVER
jgi:hypothetical protein